ncbi:hypothetical protein B0H19DRAFT_1201907 [Mycena capillaripes]|nr:hypothetical protein B0H19DRAFT_1201907 [Mycena capillaripes]
MSLEELQALIDKLSSDIEVQKEVLNQLERGKSAAQRQLNAIRDPMARLPLEISSEIFLQCLPDIPTLDGGEAPMLLLHVCNAWRDLACAIPALWTTISLEPPAGAQILEAWLRRAQNYSLSISLHNTLDDDISAVLGQYARQLKHLKLSGENLEFDFGFLTESFSQLRTLTIELVQPEDEDLSWNYIPIASIMQLLCLAPSLVECNLHGILAYSSYDATEKLVLPHLLAISFGGEIGQYEILAHISLPALQTLSIQFTDISGNTLLLFLERSLPPLQKLVLDGSDLIRGYTFTELTAWLGLVPSLAHLELCLASDAQTDFIEDLFSTLTDPSSHFLPNLRSLKILCIFTLSVSTYRTIYSSLSARHAQLVSVEIEASTATPAPEANVRDRLRQLAANGMEIYIGNSDYNYI